MRITDDRYERERAHHQLALRMIGHEARTCTIRAFTGLTDDRIRKLFHTYVGPRSTVRRRRGKSPRQVEFFTRNLAALLESSCLAGLLYSQDVIPSDAGAGLHPSLELGTRFCDAYENYLQLVSSSQMSFEHAWCLAQLLAARKEVTLMECIRCRGHHIADPIIHSKYSCPLCKIRHTPLEQIPSIKDLLGA
ncbi:MAG: FlhC family transcriptional regulator [Steroidobacteraceae bacterium]